MEYWRGKIWNNHNSEEGYGKDMNGDLYKSVSSI